jgi:hypothetical protein
MKPFKSIAHWPDGTVSDDGHDTRAAAEAVCSRLKHEGWGGERKIFPLRCEVEENRVLWQIAAWAAEPRPYNNRRKTIFSLKNGTPSRR